jgi:hypothetical protein
MNPILGSFLTATLMGLSELLMMPVKPLMALSLFCLRVIKIIDAHVHQEAPKA